MIGSLAALLCSAAPVGLQLNASQLPPSGKPKSSQNPAAPFHQGLKALQQNLFETAAADFNAALELDPSLVPARYDLGIAYFSLSRFEESKQALQRVLDESPGHPFARYFLGRINLVQGNLDAAISQFGAISQKRPVADELYYLGAAHFRKNDILRAVRVLEIEVVWRPGDYRAHLLLARAYQQAGLSPKAEREYALGESLRASYAGKSREISECQGLLQKQDREYAVARCRQMLEGDDPLKLTSLGTLLAGRQLYEQAIPPLRKAALLDAENYEPQFNLGLTYFKLKQYSQARKPLEAAVALRPESYDAIALLGSVLFALGDDFRALDQLRHAHHLSPADEKVMALLFQELRIIAQHYWAEKDYRQSIPLLEEALSLQPAVPELHLQLGQAYAAIGDTARAVREQQEARRSR